MAPGDVGNATSYPFPVRIKVVDGLTWYPPPANEWGKPRPKEVDLLVDAANELKRDGVRAIVTGCGFFSTVQDVLAKEVGIPVFTSPLILLPLVGRMISPDKKICVVTASKPHLTEGYFRSAGFDNFSRLHVVGMESCSEWTQTHMGGTRTSMDLELLREQYLQTTSDFVRGHPDIGLILVECTSFATFSADMQQQIDLPVVDYINFIEFMFSMVVQQSYKGFV